MTTRLGLLGGGAVARAIHLPILARLPGARLVALAEPDAGSLAAAARHAPGAAAVADYREVIARPDVEAVVICLPNALHAEAATAAFAAGKHVYLEKPLATTPADGPAVLDAWRRAGTCGMIGFNYRANALHQAARRILQAGALGEIVAVRGVFAAAMTSLPPWKRQRQSGGGVLLDLASHHVDLIPWLLGQPVRAVAASQRSQWSEGDSAMLALHLADGVVAQLLCALRSVEEDRIEIYGAEGKLTVDRYRSLAPEVELTRHGGARARQALALLPGLRHLPYTLTKLRAPGHEPSYGAALATFVAACRAGRQATPDLDDGYRALAVVLAAEASAASGQTIPLPPVAAPIPVGAAP